MNHSPIVSVVTPTYNRRDSLHRLLKALAQQTYPAESFEVIVIDDGSTDGTVDSFGCLSLPMHLRVLQQAHEGPAVARNLGVQQAAGQWVLFLDDDVVPHPELIARHVAAQARFPRAVVIGPMLPPSDFARPPWIRWEEEILQAQYADLAAGRYPCTPRQFYTANASLARADFLAAGGFDHQFQRAEDVELAYRLRALGVQFSFDPGAKVAHYAARSFSSWCQTPYRYGRYDVVMGRDKGHEALECAMVEFHQRNILNRWVTRACVGRRPLVQSAVWSLGGVAGLADRLGHWRTARLALSGLFNLLYWQGVYEELGSPGHLWRQVDAKAAAAAL